LLTDSHPLLDTTGMCKWWIKLVNTLIDVGYLDIGVPDMKGSKWYSSKKDLRPKRHKDRLLLENPYIN